MTTLDLPIEINLEAVHFTDEQVWQMQEAMAQPWGCRSQHS